MDTSKEKEEEWENKERREGRRRKTSNEKLRREKNQNIHPKALNIKLSIREDRYPCLYSKRIILYSY